jgi:hypothetical protein
MAPADLYHRQYQRHPSPPVRVDAIAAPEMALAMV